MQELEVKITASKVLLDVSTGRWMLPVSINGSPVKLLDVTDQVSEKVAVEWEEHRIVILEREAA